jgi:cell division topological specificity factor
MDIFKWLTRDKKSKNVAKERLKLVLIQDRTQMSPQFLEKVKIEFLEVASKYMKVDGDSMEIQLTRTRNEENNNPTPALVVSLPILEVKKSEATKN